MADESAFLKAIIERPDDDGPRLVYADWLDEQGRTARAELIRAQCQMERLDPDHPRYRSLQAKVDRLLDEHDRDWKSSFYEAGASEVRFRRGMPEEVDLNCPITPQTLDALFALGPVRHVTLILPAPGDVAQLVNSPHMPRVTELSIVHGGDEVRTDDITPLSLPYAANLRSLNIRGGLEEGAVQALARLPQITRLSLESSRLGADGALRLLGDPAHLPALSSLAMPYADLRSAGVRQLAALSHLSRLRNLDLRSNGIEDPGARALAESPHLGNLRSLHLDGNDIGNEGARALMQSPQLQHAKLFLRSFSIDLPLQVEMTRRNERIAGQQGTRRA